MTLRVHDEKYLEHPQLYPSLERPDFRVDHRRLEPGSMAPVTFTCNTVVVALAGRTPVIRKANGISQVALIQPGMACIEPVGVTESEAEIASPIECIHINLLPQLLNLSALADYDINPAKVQLAHAGGLLDRSLHQIALTFADIISRPPQSTDCLLMDGAQRMLAAHLIGHYLVDGSRPAQTRTTLSRTRLKNVLDLIEARFPETITLHELASEACLSDFHFSRLFRKATGLSPSHYVTRRRIQEAQSLLKLHHHSLIEIAEKAGFGSQGNFNRAFRKSVGMTPGEFRALHHR